MRSTIIVVLAVIISVAALAIVQRTSPAQSQARPEAEGLVAKVQRLEKELNDLKTSLYGKEGKPDGRLVAVETNCGNLRRDLDPVIQRTRDLSYDSTGALVVGADVRMLRVLNVGLPPDQTPARKPATGRGRYVISKDGIAYFIGNDPGCTVVHNPTSL